MAFAPTLTGIPYYEKRQAARWTLRNSSYDVGRLFENVSDLQITSQAFRKIAVVKLQCRSLGTDAGLVFNDIRQTAFSPYPHGAKQEKEISI